MVWAGATPFLTRGGETSPYEAGLILSKLQNWTTGVFGAWYIWVTAFFAIVCISIALWPKSGRIKLGQGDEKPEFSRFSWFSMMFGAGIGIGMLGYAAGEPLFHFANNPEIIQSKQAIVALFGASNITIPEGADIFALYHQMVDAGTVTALEGIATPKTMSAVESAYRYTFLHWGVGAWASYALIGIAISFFAYNRGLPLTVRSGLASLFGNKLEGTLGHIIDCLLYTSPSPRDGLLSRMPSSA